MTDDQVKMVANFEARVRQLMFLCERLKQENADLKSLLVGQKALNESLTEENEQLKNKYDHLKMAKIISVRQNDFNTAKKRLSNLVREVDKCIALLNE
jgi:predicted RNase H-like nuclease (RuvC/YqgF family)